MKTFNRVFTVIVFLFLYIPMIVLAVASFNTGTDIAVWKGFTFSQYGALFRDNVLLPLLLNSLIVAVLSSLIATVLGTLIAPVRGLATVLDANISGLARVVNAIAEQKGA